MVAFVLVEAKFGLAYRTQFGKHYKIVTRVQASIARERERPFRVTLQAVRGQNRRENTRWVPCDNCG